MKAMIFAAGLGTRLKPYTLKHPKALVPVGGIPMLQRVIVKLKATGIRTMVINVHHFGRQITDFLHANNDFGCELHVSDESDQLLDTGGGLLKAREWLCNDSESILIHNADILTDFDISEMANAHNESHATATLLVAERDTSRYLLMDAGMRLHGWTNVKSGQVRPAGINADGLGKYAFGGVHIVSPGIFASLSEYREPDTPFSITDYYIDTCQSVDIRGYEPAEPYHWLDIGKLDTLAAAQSLLSHKNV